MKLITKKYILVFGMPRSGTTWIGKIFDSHPDTMYLHEPDTEKMITELPRFVRPHEYQKHLNFASEYLLSLPNKASLRVNGKLPLFRKKYSYDILNLLIKFNIYLAKLLEQVNIKIGLINYTNFIKNKPYVIVWKSIESFARIGLLLEAKKNLSLVYIIRHPCGQIASVLNGEDSNFFVSNSSISEDYGYFEALNDIEFIQEKKYNLDSVKEMSQIQKLALRWAMINDQAIEAIEKHSERATVVRYEDFCIDPKGQAKKIFSKTNLSWNNQTANFCEKNKSESNSYYSVVKIPEKSMNKWKKQLTEKEVNEIKQIVIDSKAGQLFKNFF